MQQPEAFKYLGRYGISRSERLADRSKVPVILHLLEVKDAQPIW